MPWTATGVLVEGWAEGIPPSPHAIELPHCLGVEADLVGCTVMLLSLLGLGAGDSSSEPEASIMPPSWRTRLMCDRAWDPQETAFFISKA